MSVTITEYDCSAVIKLRPGTLTIIILAGDNRWDFIHETKSTDTLNALAMFNPGHPDMETAYLGCDRAAGDKAWAAAGIGKTLAVDIAIVETEDE